MRKQPSSSSGPTLTGDARSRAHHRLEALVAEAAAAADYAAGLGAAGGVANDEVLVQIQAAIGRYYLVGQLVAMPTLALKPFPRATGARRVRLAEPRLLPVPDAPGFDRWCLTDPRVVPVLKRAKRACRTIDALWRDDGDPTRTLAIKADIDAALFRGDVALEAGHFDTCPWSPIYLVKRPVRIGGRRLHPLDEFTYVVEVVPGLRQSRVRRRIVTGPFYPSRPKAEHGAR